MFYTVYRTTNLVNGSKYYGCHKTDNPNDDYLGSGKWLLRAIAKYGRENFVKEILAIFDNPQQAFDLEREIIDRELGLPGCYNLKRGGEGGYDFINASGKSGAVQGGRAARKKIDNRKKIDPEFCARMEEVSRKNLLNFQKSERGRVVSRINLKKATEAAATKWKEGRGEETRRSLSESQLGEKNSQFGSRWIHKGSEILKVRKGEISGYLEQGWKLGTKLKIKKEKKLRLIFCKNCKNLFAAPCSESMFCSKRCNAVFYHKIGNLKAPFLW
jgi:hypothetical protein